MRAILAILTAGLVLLASCLHGSDLRVATEKDPLLREQLTACKDLIEKHARYQEAAHVCERTMLNAIASLGSADPLTVDAISQLGRVRYFLDDFSGAEARQRQALEILTSAPVADHAALGAVYYRLGAVYHALGQFSLAEHHYQRAHEAWTHFPGQHPKEVAQIHNNLGVLYAQQHRYSDAEDEHRKALAIRQRAVPALRTELAQSYHNLADVAWSLGRFAEGKGLAEAALSIRRQLHPPGHPSVASTLLCLANFHWVAGDYDRAQALNYEALGSYEKSTGPLSQEAGWSLRNLVQIDLSRGIVPSALERLDRWLRIGELHLGATRSRQQAEALIQRLQEGAQWAYGLHSDPRGARLALRTSLLMKGRIIDLGALSQQRERSLLTDPNQQQRVVELQALRQQLLQHELSRSIQETSQYERIHRELALRIVEAEQVLAVKEVGTVMTSAQLPSPDEIVSKVASSLAADGALLEILWVRPYDFRTLGLRDEERWQPPRYVALLLFPSGRLEVRDLGAAAWIDRQAQGLIEGLRNRKADWLDQAQALYTSVLAPFSDSLTKVRSLTISPDGMLNLIPFDVLHDGRQELLSRFDSLVYLTSGRDVLRHSSQQPTTSPIVLADPDFSAAIPGESQSPATHAVTVTLSHAETGLYDVSRAVGRLPGTASEAQYIHQLRPDARLLLGSAATERSVREVRSPQFLVFATHGVFLSRKESERWSAARAMGYGLSRGLSRPVGRLPPIDETEHPTTQHNPMSATALLLAGAGRAAHGMDPAVDGHLLAEEARLLDLSGTALVVLSACDTGLGEVETSQGVVGLRRAFQVAGAEALVTSLWRVDDKGTSDLMYAYWRLVLRGQPRIGALRQAMRQIKHRRPHPYFWAPFIGIGLDLPLPSKAPNGGAGRTH